MTNNNIGNETNDQTRKLEMDKGEDAEMTRLIWEDEQNQLESEVEQQSEPEPPSLAEVMRSDKNSYVNTDKQEEKLVACKSADIKKAAKSKGMNKKKATQKVKKKAVKKGGKKKVYKHQYDEECVEWAEPKGYVRDDSVPRKYKGHPKEKGTELYYLHQKNTHTSCMITLGSFRSKALDPYSKKVQIMVYDWIEKHFFVDAWFKGYAIEMHQDVRFWHVHIVVFNKKRVGYRLCTLMKTLPPEMRAECPVWNVKAPRKGNRPVNWQASKVCYILNKDEPKWMDNAMPAKSEDEKKQVLVRILKNPEPNPESLLEKMGAQEAAQSTKSGGAAFQKWVELGWSFEKAYDEGNPAQRAALAKNEDLYRKMMKLWENKQNFEKKYAPKFAYESFTPYMATNVRKAIELWRAKYMHKRALVLYLKSNAGKTHLAKSLFKFPLMVTSPDDFPNYVPGRHDGIVIDDVHFGYMTKEKFFNWCTVDHTRTINNVKYGKFEFPEGLPRVFTTNRPLWKRVEMKSKSGKLYKGFHREAQFLPAYDSEHDKKSITRRLLCIPIQDYLYDISKTEADDLDEVMQEMFDVDDEGNPNKPPKQWPVFGQKGGGAFSSFTEGYTPNGSVEPRAIENPEKEEFQPAMEMVMEV